MKDVLEMVQSQTSAQETPIAPRESNVPPSQTSDQLAGDKFSQPTVSAPKKSSQVLRDRKKPAPQPPPGTHKVSEVTTPASRGLINQIPTSSQGSTRSASASGSANPTSEAVNQQSHNSDISSPAASQWKYLPPPENEPEPSPEYHRYSNDSPEGLKLIGARVRGKKHKHEGTHCDDWFKFAVSGPWTIIAASDGAGSKKFSRVGAKVSCEAAVEQLATSLEDYSLTNRVADEWPEALQRDDNGIFAGEDLEFVQNAVHKAMLKAYDAVKQAAAERRNSADHYEALGNRRLEIKDLSATLLLAVHTTVKYRELDCSFVLACQVGDGITAAVESTGGLQVLGVPDSGGFSGETEFLTNEKMLDEELLWRKTFGFFRPLRALMVMTDGVADDYFPNDPHLLRLYGDLVLNQVIGIQGPSDGEIAKALKETKLPTLDDVAKATFDSQCERITDNGTQRIPIRNVATYAEKLGVEVSSVVASPALLSAGSRGKSMCDESSPEGRLEVWLDSYQVRGSFDDRTLVVLYQEVVS